MSNSEIKLEAKQKISGKRWPYIVGMLISVAAVALSFAYIGGIITLIITGPLSLGLTGVSLMVMRNKTPEINDVFKGFNNFKNAFVAYVLQAIYLFLWGLLIIPAFIKPFSYALTYHILYDNPEMSANDAITKSREMMNGHKWELFCLMFSFIGWYLLSILTLGILMFWVEPYLNAAIARFYQNLKNENPDAVDLDVDSVDGTVLPSESESEKASEEKIKCPVCGAENEPGSKFCYACGEKLEKEEE